MENQEKVRVDREFFADLINDAVAVLAERTNSDYIFAAPLAARIRDLLRIRLQNPDVTLVGSFFAPILYPTFSPAEQAQLKFRHFLESFPELVEVCRLPSGDKVRLRDRTKDSAAMEAQETKSANIVKGIAPTNPAQLAYLIIDSASFLDALHIILNGVKPGPKSLPNWEQLRKYLQQRFPAKEWKARFLMTVASSQGDGVEGFKGYLEAVGFGVIQLALDSQPYEMGEIRKERCRVGALATSKLLSHIATTTVNGHVFVVTHSPTVVTNLSDLLKRCPVETRIGVIGFPEYMDPGLLRLKENGLQVVDMETEAKAFKTPLPRRQLISANDFDPAKFL